MDYLKKYNLKLLVPIICFAKRVAVKPNLNKKSFLKILSTRDTLDDDPERNLN